MESYANCADHRDAKGQMGLFTESANYIIYANAKDASPSLVVKSREGLSSIFAKLNNYEVTTHFLGQSKIILLDRSHAQGEAYCLAHYIAAEGPKQTLMVESLRYVDTFVKTGARWLFAERKVYVDWKDTRQLS